MLYKKHKFILLKMNVLEEKIIFTKSIALQVLYNNLEEQDIKVLCKINEILLLLS
jgi:hypothetical protein